MPDEQLAMAAFLAKFEAFKAVNRARYKARGCTHRVEIEVLSFSGEHLRTQVSYERNPRAEDTKNFILRNGGALTTSRVTIERL